MPSATASTGGTPSIGGSGEPTRLGVNRRGSSKAEAEYGLNLPPDIYPIFENALRARRGLDLATHQRRLGVRPTVIVDRGPPRMRSGIPHMR